MQSASLKEECDKVLELIMTNREHLNSQYYFQLRSMRPELQDAQDRNLSLNLIKEPKMLN